ncbi:uncharacterized protein A4U43_C08F24580 [Asparagus officinalis]|nr:uncharacterized protein A4U43_C08F24580 [Asparagus officinalis]
MMSIGSIDDNEGDWTVRVRLSGGEGIAMTRLSGNGEVEITSSIWLMERMRVMARSRGCQGALRDVDEVSNGDESSQDDLLLDESPFSQHTEELVTTALGGLCNHTATSSSESPPSETCNGLSRTKLASSAGLIMYPSKETSLPDNDRIDEKCSRGLRFQQTSRESGDLQMEANMKLLSLSLPHQKPANIIICLHFLHHHLHASAVASAAAATCPLRRRRATARSRSRLRRAHGVVTATARSRSRGRRAHGVVTAMVGQWRSYVTAAVGQWQRSDDGSSQAPVSIAAGVQDLDVGNGDGGGVKKRMEKLGLKLGLRFSTQIGLVVEELKEERRRDPMGIKKEWRTEREQRKKGGFFIFFGYKKGKERTERRENWFCGD